MKKALMLSVLLLLVLGSYAQTTTVHMDYNPAGKRTNRTILYTLEKIQSPVIKRDSLKTNDSLAVAAFDSSQMVQGLGAAAQIPAKSKYDLAMFPNPAGNLLKISCTQQASENATISIRDLSGKEMIRQHINLNYSEIDLSSLNASAYTVELRYGNNVQYWKIIKQ